MKNTTYGIKTFTKNRENPFKHNAVDESINKIFTQINKVHISKVFGLSRTGLKLLFYFTNNYTVNDHVFYFNLKDSKAFLGFRNKRSIYNALIELLGEQIIARTDKENFYYLNEGIIKAGG